MSELTPEQLKNLMLFIEDRLVEDKWSRRYTVRHLTLEHDMTEEDAKDFYKKVVKSIADDEFCNDDETERALWVAGLRREIQAAGGDPNLRLKAIKEFSEARNIAAPKKVDVNVYNADTRREGEIIASVLEKFGLEQEEHEEEDHEVE